jgi:HAD superfamily hydrolase (TIGR01509 family)
MKPALQVALFDLGNTLLYDIPEAWPEVYARAEVALWSALRRAGVRVTPGALYDHNESLLRYYYRLRQSDLEEPGMARVLQALLLRQNIGISEQNLQAALRSMYAVTQTNWFPEEDAASTAEALRGKGLRLGAVSNGADDLNARQLLAKAGLRPYFEYIVTSAAFGWRKPHPGIFRAALDHFGVPAELAVMVGDTYEADILGAHAVGLNTIWITRRVRQVPPAIPIEPDFTVVSLNDVAALIR